MTRTRHISADLPCTGCGYNLRTIGRQGRCPECGRAVAGVVVLVLGLTASVRGALGESGRVRGG